MTQDSPAVTDEQAAAVAATAPFYLRACPGAGKTRVLIDRHTTTPVGWQRQGRALISFTNRAADEIKERCDRPELLASPHFVGTLDVFLWRFLVRPFLPAGGHEWRRLLEWSDLGNLPKVFGRVPLNLFSFAYDSSIKDVLTTLPNATTLLLNHPRSEQAFCHAANSLRLRLTEKHRVLTGLEVRMTALKNSADPTVADLLRRKFLEIAVDEAQDCEELELEILGNLLDRATPIVVVADPHQSIYGYKGAYPAKFAQFTGRFAEQFVLTGNHRSSERICELAGSMRLPAVTSDRALGPWKEERTSLLLIPFATRQRDRAATAVASAAAAVPIFLERATKLEPPCETAFSLAFADSAVPRTGRPSPKAPTKASAAVRLAWACAINRDESSGREELIAAFRLCQSLLCDLWFPEDLGHTEQVLAAHGIDTFIARRYVASLLVRLPEVDERPASDWRREAVKIMNDHPRLADANAGQLATSGLGISAKNAQRPIAELVGLPLSQAIDAPSGLEEIPSTVHKAKGGEADAVLITLPEPGTVTELVEAWSETDSSELLRVYYVAVTRARRLVCFTYPYKSHRILTDHLTRLGIPFETAPDTPRLEPATRHPAKRRGVADPGQVMLPI
jgi:DNA helicase-2/ATP-dependent DNA helicase PcrA